VAGGWRRFGDDEVNEFRAALDPSLQVLWIVLSLTSMRLAIGRVRPKASNAAARLGSAR